MKFLVLSLLFFCFLQIKAQEFEIKVISNKYQTVKGQLKKVSVEGIGVEDYKGNYLVFRPAEISRIKIKKRGLTIGEGAVTGTLGGLAVGALLLTAESEVFNTASVDLYKITIALGVIGGTIGTITGVIAELVNTRLVLRINENAANFQANYQKLEQYLNTIVTHHVN